MQFYSESGTVSYNMHRMIVWRSPSVTDRQPLCPQRSSTTNSCARDAFCNMWRCLCIDRCMIIEMKNSPGER